MYKLIECGRRAGLAAAMFVLSAGAASADPDHVWARVRATDASVAADLAACVHEARDLPAPDSPPNYVHARTAEGAAAGYLAEAFIANLREEKVETRVIRRCMRRRAYVWLPLTHDEAAALAGQTSPKDRAAWLDAFYARDLSARIDVADTEMERPPSEAGDEPLTFGGVRFDPRELAAAGGPVTVGQAVLIGWVRPF